MFRQIAVLALLCACVLAGLPGKQTVDLGDVGYKEPSGGEVARAEARETKTKYWLDTEAKAYSKMIDHSEATLLAALESGRPQMLLFCAYWHTRCRDVMATMASLVEPLGEQGIDVGLVDINSVAGLKAAWNVQMNDLPDVRAVQWPAGARTDDAPNPDAGVRYKGSFSDVDLTRFAERVLKGDVAQLDGSQESMKEFFNGKGGVPFVLLPSPTDTEANAAAEEALGNVRRSVAHYAKIGVAGPNFRVPHIQAIDDADKPVLVALRSLQKPQPVYSGPFVETDIDDDESEHEELLDWINTNSMFVFDELHEGTLHRVFNRNRLMLVAFADFDALDREQADKSTDGTKPTAGSQPNREMLDLVRGVASVPGNEYVDDMDLVYTNTQGVVGSKLFRGYGFRNGTDDEPRVLLIERGAKRFWDFGQRFDNADHLTRLLDEARRGEGAFKSFEELLEEAKRKREAEEDAKAPNALLEAAKQAVADYGIYGAIGVPAVVLTVMTVLRVVAHHALKEKEE